MSSLSDICQYCGHRLDWHEWKYNKSVEKKICQCIGTRPDQNRNWCDCPGFNWKPETD